MKNLIKFGFVFLLLAGLTFGQGRALKIEDYYKIKSVGDVQISPNGKWVVYITYDKNDVRPGDHPANKHVELRLVPAEGGESKAIVKVFGGQGTMNVNSWSPDNRTIAFVSYRLKQ